ncbi:hypothetical protein Poli38472_009609 [Pythium oligandrum]|uniref:Spore coat protein CotH n=1 Tax=Pythium oligandrum TaxID=41045 RepID=A0A8K1FGX5_PYTOL|nr:hypothetical protein Poli38472_009609 [Pythium oligandrum]|eukprot:TMW62116.1 hypothetical protein Poli38472_009609 [Pythium oligandrum]
MHWKIAAIAALLSVATTTSVTAESPKGSCFELPVVIVTPTKEPFPGKVCKPDPIPSQDCRKRPVENTVEVIDHFTDGAFNCVDDLPTQVYKSVMHYRGQSSLGFKKHQYTVKLDEDVPFLGFPEDRRFVLNGPLIDGSLMRNHLAHWMFRGTGRYSPRTRHFVFYIRDPETKELEYFGIYLALEKITYGKNRVNLAPLDNQCTTPQELSGGWAWQLNPLNYGVYSPNIISDPYQLMFGSGERPVLMHPKPQVMTQTMRDYFVNASTGPLPQLYRYLFRNMTHPDILEKHIDLGSFVDYLLHSELSQNSDAYRRSTYFFKDREQPINAGPVWDFNLAYGLGNNNPDWLFRPFLLWRRLTINYKFVALIAKRWRALRADVWSDESIKQFIESSAAPLRRQIKPCKKWQGRDAPCAFVKVEGSYDSHVENMQKSVLARAKWMDENVVKLYGPVERDIWGMAIHIPHYNCGPNGTDSGCLTDPEKYINAVEFPPLRQPYAGGDCPKKEGPVEEPSIDPCWLSVGSYAKDVSITRFCSGHGSCPPGPGAKCTCTRHHDSPNCGSVPGYYAYYSMNVASPQLPANAPSPSWSESAAVAVFMVFCVAAALVIVYHRKAGRWSAKWSEKRPLQSALSSAYGT